MHNVQGVCHAVALVSETIPRLRTTRVMRLCFSDRASQCRLVSITNLMHDLFTL